jgi:hypothetical protein
MGWDEARASRRNAGNKSLTMNMSSWKEELYLSYHKNRETEDILSIIIFTSKCIIRLNEFVSRWNLDRINISIATI